MDIIVDEVPTLDSLKNPNNISLEVEDVVDSIEKSEETHLEYKKRFNHEDYYTKE